jgi:leucyl-tRNA synthetase
MSADFPSFRYNATFAATLESKWQDFWEDNATFNTPNPAGPLALSLIHI